MPGQVHDSGLLLRPLPGPGLVVPDVLVHPDRVDPPQPVGVVGQLLEQWFDRRPDGVPVHPEPARHGLDRGVVPGDAADRPPRRPPGQLRPRPSQLMGFTEPADRTRLFGAAVAPLSPHQCHRGAERGNVVQLPQPSTPSLGDHATARAARLGHSGLHDQS
jgi:hypothetical protein